MVEVNSGNKGVISPDGRSLNHFDCSKGHHSAARDEFTRLIFLYTFSIFDLCSYSSNREK